MTTTAVPAQLELKVQRERDRSRNGVIATVTLRNRGDQSLWVNRRMLVNAASAPPPMRELWFEVQGPDDKPLPFETKVHAGNAGPEHYRNLPAGASIETTVTLSDYFPFAAKGHYTIQAHYQDGNEVIQPSMGQRHLHELVNSNVIEAFLYEPAEPRRVSLTPKAVGALRLSEPALFPRTYRFAAKAVAAELKKDHEDPGEYFANVEPEAGSGGLVFHLWHKDAFKPENARMRGNPGGKCRDFYYDPLQKKITQKLFWQ